MSKYIIDIEEKPLCVFDKDTQTYFPRLWRVEGFNSLVFDEEGLSRLEELNADYINENYGQLQDTAYQKGLEEGKKAFDLLESERNFEYQRGLEDAWEAAKKLFSTMAESDIERAFPIEWNSGGFKALMNLHPQQAIERLKAYEEKRKAEVPIMAGDEVKAEDGTVVFIVTWMSDRCICGVDKEGKCYSYEPKEICGKTGRHFDIILEEKKA